MKSIFRKIAFVLALAMVVTLFPVMSASAANNGNKYARTKDATLYVGGDANGDYESCWAAQTKTKTWMKEEGYKSSYKTSDENVVTVSKYGFVEAVGVGKAEITATFSKEGEDDIVETFNVTVKKNAVSIALDKESQDALAAGLTAGDTVTLKAVQTDADGSNEGITDTVKFYCSSAADKEIIELNKDTGELTALKDGKATIVVQSCQYEYDRETKKYKTTVATKAEYPVEVKAAGIVSVKQFSTDTVSLACGNADVAAALAKDFSALTVQYMLGDNPIQTFIKSAEVDSADNKVVKITLYSAMEKDVVYKFTYKEKSLELRAVDPDAIASIRIVTTQVPVQTEYEIEVQFLDANGVIINPGTNNLTFTAEDSSDYSLYPKDNNKGCIYFFEAGKTAQVKATYEMGWDEKGNKLPDKTASAVITSKLALDANNMIGYAVAPVEYENGGYKYKKASDLTYTTSVSIVRDEETQLYAKYTANKLTGGTADFYNESSDPNQKQNDNFYFKYVSTNDAIVFVNELSGVMKGNSTGTAQIIIYRVIGDKEVVVGTVTVKVESTRVFTSIDMNLNKTKLSDISTGETAKITVDAKDQLSKQLASSGDLVYSAKLVNNVPGVSLTVGGTPLTTDYQGITISSTENDGRANFDVQVTVDPTLATGPKNIQISIQVRQDLLNINKVLGRSLQVKYPGAVRTHSLDLGKSAIDVNLLQASSSWNDLTSTISLNAYDQDGFYVKSEAMVNMTSQTQALAQGTYGYIVTKGTDIIPSAGQEFKAVTISGTSISKTISGASIAGRAVDSKGTYTVKVYEGTTNTPRQYKVKSIVVTDSTVTPVVTVSNNRISSITPANVWSELEAKLKADRTLVIKRSGNNISDNVNIVGGFCRDVQSNRVYVEYITVVETINGGKYNGNTFTYNIPVNQVFYTNY